MLRNFNRLLVAVMLVQAAPALAEERAGTGSVLQMASLSQSLFRSGEARKDPLLMLTAAKIRKQVGWRAGSLSQVGGEADPDVEWLDWETMIETALTFAPGNELLAELAEDIRAERSKGRKDDPMRTGGRIKPGDKVVYPKVPFDGGEYAEVYIEGSGTSNIDIFVHDTDGYLVCSDSGASDIAYCGWNPTAAGEYDISIINKGKASNRYSLMTN